MPFEKACEIKYNRIWWLLCEVDDINNLIRQSPSSLELELMCFASNQLSVIPGSDQFQPQSCGDGG